MTSMDDSGEVRTADNEADIRFNGRFMSIV